MTAEIRSPLLRSCKSTDLSNTAELGITVDKIGYHLRHIYEKLQVHSKSEAVAKALRDRIIS
jgi:hypothetical protein